jgi:hypothetical protein
MTRQRRLFIATVGALIASGSLALAPAATHAATRRVGSPVVKQHDDPRLGGGLGRLVEQAKHPSLRKQHGLVSDQSRLAIKDSRGRIKVDLTPQAGVDRAAFRQQAEAQGLDVTAVDPDLGTLEGFVAVGSTQKLAALKGTGTITQALKPILRAGAATTQGVAFQRVDKVLKKGINGKGITVGVLSDSYDDAKYTVLGDPLKIHAQQDIKSGDLPGKGNKAYPDPVVVLQDDNDPDADTDEGRAMLQIVHDIAPAAKLCFATAYAGEVAFANNIRKLAAKSGPCKADVIVDDVGYFDEPSFSDGPIGDAVDDVAAKGVHYFSAAGNDGEQQSWDSPVRLIPEKQGVKGTNLDFSQVDPALYSGGLQDMNTGAGTDVAQNMLVGDAGGLMDLQWDDPFDANGAQYGKTLFSAQGQLTDANPSRDYDFTVTKANLGKKLMVRDDAVPSGTLDLSLSVTAPDGTDLADVDNVDSPELFAFTPTQAGTYTVTVGSNVGATGPFIVDVRQVLAPSRTTTDFNLLFFDMDGNYLGASADDNPAIGRPLEIFPVGGIPEMQVVISRAGTGPMGATQLRDTLYSDAYFDEYVNPVAPAIFGHPLARGATAVGAMDPFKPFLPEYYTSPGGNLPIKFDSKGNRYSKVQYRHKPEVTGTDRGNTTFFVVDDTRDPDSQPNFGGTSAAAPHIAAIAALVLQKHGGPSSVSPTAMRSLLEGSTFPHDLDPMHSGGTAGGVTVQADGPQGFENDVANGPMTDRNFFKVGYSGSAKVKSLTFYADTASPTSLAGMVFDPRKLGPADASYRDNGFPFTVGATAGGLAAKSVSASFAGANAGDSAPGQYRRMTLSFAKGLGSGQGLSFGVDRDLAVSGFGGANEGNGADELGGATFIPSGQVQANGLKFVATLTNGKTVTGFVRNKIGAGFSPVDGYGLVNAEKAVLGH